MIIDDSYFWFQYNLGQLAAMLYMNMNRAVLI